MEKQNNIDYWQYQYPGETKITPPKYWVEFCKITRDDVNEVLRIYAEVSKKKVTFIEDEDFEKKSKIFKSSRGLVEDKIAPGAILEWRRYIAPEGFYVRFTIGGRNSRLNVQDQIDEYFINKKIAKPHTAIS